MDLWIARDADGALKLLLKEPEWDVDRWRGWQMRYIYHRDFPDLPPGHKQRVMLVPDGEPIRG